MITLEDIARQAGVSHSTVSRALADSPLVNRETKKRIQELAEKAGYQVNLVARNLKTRSTKTIGLVVPEVSNPYYPKLIQSIADRTREADYTLQLHLSGADQEEEAACLAHLRSQRVDGILLVTAEQGLVARETVEALSTSGVPVVLMGWVEDAEHLDTVMGDDSLGGEALAKHLVELGHRRIATLGKLPHRGVHDRLFGFQTVLEASGIALPEEVRIVASTDAEVKVGVKRLLALPEPPTAIFAYQDSLAALVIGHLADACVSVPEQMTVVGFDDLDLASYLCPRLTTIGGHIEPLATQFVELLLERLQKSAPDTAPRHLVISPTLMMRGSCAPPYSRKSLEETR